MRRYCKFGHKKPRNGNNSGTRGGGRGASRGGGSQGGSWRGKSRGGRQGSSGDSRDNQRRANFAQENQEEADDEYELEVSPQQNSTDFPQGSV